LIYPFAYVGLFILPLLAPPDRKRRAQTLQLILIFYTIFHVLFIARYYYLVPLLPVVYGVALAVQYRYGSRLWHRMTRRA
jgi:hypothetical protein